MIYYEFIYIILNDICTFLDCIIIYYLDLFYMKLSYFGVNSSYYALLKVKSTSHDTAARNFYFNCQPNCYVDMIL